jgi:hypothetical protein
MYWLPSGLAAVQRRGKFFFVGRLGHKSQQATAVYARLDLDPVREVMETAPLMGWRSSGVILSRNELSACASASCDARLPKGVDGP